MLKDQILTPYCGVCYRLKDYYTRGPQNPKEIFNLQQHCSSMLTTMMHYLLEVDNELLQSHVDTT